LQLNAISREVYKEALEEYTTSEMRAKYLYGLQRLDYREGRYDDALKNHAFIINLYAENEIRPDADYLAGQIYFERKNYSAAEQILNSINPGSAAYLYAQYTLSIINLDQNKIQQALTNLSNVISDSTQDVGERLLQDGAYLKMGHIFFEQGDKLRQAVEAYQRVSPGTYQDEAFLGMSWAWIKVNKPEICLQTIEQMLLQYPKSALVPEAYLVKGYSLMLLRRYRDAVDALDKSLQLVKGEFIGEQELANRSREHNRVVQDFLPTSQDIKKNALRKPTSRTLEDRPNLKVAFDKFNGEGDEFFAYQLVAKSHTKFFMRKEQIISDAEYALAKATNMLKSRKATEQIQDQQEKQQDIDKQIQKLEEQLKNIE
jgi:tetratricopeptide (TPR) repeat protein